MTSALSEFDPQRVVNLVPPIFVRKVDRRSHWRNDSNGNAIQSTLGKVFPEGNGAVSMFRVETCEDFFRVAIGLNSYRSSLTEELFLLCISNDELQNSGLDFHPAIGKTKCEHANQCHFNIVFHGDRFSHLIRMLVNSQRELLKLNKKMMGRAENQATLIGCRATNSCLNICECQS